MAEGLHTKITLKEWRIS